MPEVGNASQVGVIAEQLFDAWEARRVVEEKRRHLLFGALPGWIACVLSVVAVLWQAAVTTQRVNENTRRIEIVEVQQREQERDDKATVQQLARIEAKVDLVIGEKIAQ